jgi:hypothetical protein
MALEAPPASVATDGNLRITFVDDASNPLSVAALNSGDDITYSLTPSGVHARHHGEQHRRPQADVEADLQPARHPPRRPSRCSTSGATPTTSPTACSRRGRRGFLVVRYATPNATAYTTGQKVDVLTVLAGKQRRDAPTANGLFTISQNLYITDVTKNDQTLVV